MHSKEKESLELTDTEKLLVAQMHRAIDLIAKGAFKRVKEYGLNYRYYEKDVSNSAELDATLREVRRTSVRYQKEQR